MESQASQSTVSELDLWLIELIAAFDLEAEVSNGSSKHDPNTHNSPENILNEKDKIILMVAEKALQIDFASHPQIRSYFDTCIAYYQIYEWDKSESQQSLTERSTLGDRYYQLGMDLFKQNNHDGAIAAFQITLAIQSDRAQAYCNLGAILALREQFTEAISCYQEAIAICPDLAEAYYNLGASLLRLEQLDAAIAHLQTAIALRPNWAEAYSKLGATLFQKDCIEEAISQYQKALQIEPNMAETHFNLGVALSEQRQVQDAISAFQQAIAAQPYFPDAHTNLAVSMLVSGNYDNGWEEYEWRWQRRGMEMPLWSQPLWDGSSLAGQTILLWAEQGFGDTIQFIRYIPFVKARGGRVIVQCPACLLRLLATVDGIDRLVTENDELAEQIHCYAPLVSLPRFFETTLASIPNKIPYLQVRNDGSEEAVRTTFLSSLHTPSHTQANIGIVWASSYKGDPTYLKFQQKKSCPLSLFTELLALPHIHWYSLQLGQEVSDITMLKLEEEIEDLSPQIQDFADTATLIEQMDLVISVDTAVAHLAGSMGKSVWVLLPYVADWRWLLDREDSPWYPTMRLFRQKQTGGWTEVLLQVKQALGEYISDRM